MFRFIFLFSLICFWTSSFSQEKLKVKEAAYDFMLKHEAYSFFKNQRQLNRYIDLFTINVDSIPNDILPDNNISKKISFKEYAMLRSKYCKLPYKAEAKIDSLKLIPQYKGGYKLNAFVTKIIHIEHFNNDQSERKDYIDTLQYKYSLVQNKTSFLIDGIDCISEDVKYLRLVTNLKKSELVLINDKEFMVDSNKEVFLKYRLGDTLKLNSFSKDYKSTLLLHYNYFNDHIALSKKEKRLLWDKNQRVTHFRSKKVKLGFTYSSIVQNDYVNINSKSIGQINSRQLHSRGIGLSYSLGRFTQFATWELKFEPRVSDYSIAVTESNISYSFTAQDSDGDDYLRHVYLRDVNEESFFRTFDMPLGLQINFHTQKQAKYNNTIGKWSSAVYPFVFMGGIVSLNTSSNYLINSEVEYNGQYENLFNYTFTEDFHDFGVYKLSGEGSNTLNSLNYGAEVGFGLVMDYRNELFIQTGLSLMYYNNTPLVNESEELITIDPDEINSLFKSGLNYSLNLITYKISLVKRL